MKEFFESKNFIKGMLILGIIFLVIVVAQFVSIGVLSHKNNALSNEIGALTQQETYYEGVKENAMDSTYAQNYAKEEGNMKNPNEEIYKAN